MPKSVLTRRRGLFAKLTVVALVTSMLVIGAAPAGAAIDTSASCPSNIPSAGFTDLGGFDATTVLAINCLVHYGISQGTSATTFSPNLSVTRWQMALFLTRQAVDHGLTLPSGADQGFTDIGGLDSATQTAINQLKQLGITAGTSATTFSPNLVVSRWQMALFLVRLAAAAGVTLPSGAAQGFTDISSLSTEAQTAINQAKQLGIADGFTATTFSPNTDTLRWQMALFLTRTLAADGILPTGLGFTVTAINLATDVITYDNNGVSATVDYTGGTSFTVDGVAATMAAFEAALTVGDKIAFSGTGPSSFALTNVTVSGGLISDVNYAGDTFDIVLPSGPTVSDNLSFVPAGVNAYTVGGTAVTQATFEANLSNGDTIAISGASPGTVASPRTFALTNATVTGTVASVGGAVNWRIVIASGASLGPIDLDVPGGDALVLTIGGSAVTQATFEAPATGLSNGDSVTYGRASGIVTAALTNQAAAPQTGRVLDFDVAANTVTFDPGAGGTSVTTVDYTTASFAISVGGATATAADLEAAINVGDSVTYQAPDAATSNAGSLALTNGATSGTPSAINTAANFLTLQFDSNGPAGPTGGCQAVVGISYAVATDPCIVNGGLAGNTAVVYQINGAVATEANWEAAVSGIIGGLSGSIAVADSGTNTVWNVTSP